MPVHGADVPDRKLRTHGSSHLPHVGIRCSLHLGIQGRRIARDRLPNSRLGRPRRCLVAPPTASGLDNRDRGISWPLPTIHSTGGSKQCADRPVGSLHAKSVRGGIIEQLVTVRTDLRQSTTWRIGDKVFRIHQRNHRSCRYSQADCTKHGEINIETRYWEGFPEPTVQDVVACPLCLKYAIKELAEQIENEIDARRDERNADRKASR